MTVFYADEVAQYIRDAVARFADTNIPGQTIFQVECNCNPHSNTGLNIEFKIFARNEWVKGPNFLAVIEEHARRHAIKQQLSPLMIERHPHNDPVPAPALDSPELADERVPGSDDGDRYDLT